MGLGDLVTQVPPFPAKLREDNVRTGFVEGADYDKLAAACSREDAARKLPCADRSQCRQRIGTRQRPGGDRLGFLVRSHYRRDLQWVTD